MSFVIGNDHKLYRNTGTQASPTWAEVCIVGDVSLDISVSDAPVNLRCSSFKTGLPAKIEVALNFTLGHNFGNTQHTALRTAALARTIANYAVANGAIATTGNQYFRFWGHITKFPWNQSVEEIANGECTVAPSYYEDSGTIIDPSWTVVS